MASNTKKYLGNYVGIVIQNNDPERSGKVKVFIPHITATVYKKWVEENAGDYGFEITYKEDGPLRKKEPWHLFYVGIFSEDEDDDNDVK